MSFLYVNRRRSEITQELRDDQESRRERVELEERRNLEFREEARAVSLASVASHQALIASAQNLLER